MDGMSVNLEDLRRVKRDAEDLRKELLESVKVTVDSRAHANEAKRKHSQIYVTAAANDVLKPAMSLKPFTELS